MAPTEKKRKLAPTNESFARGRPSKNGDSARPAKRPRPEQGDGAEESATKAPLPSRLTQRSGQEVVAFPRGGASILTPLEHKQIRIEATRDALFELEEEKASAQQIGSTTGKSSNRQKSKSKTKGRSIVDDSKENENTVKIEGLSFKRIVRGSLILGQVSEINEQDIALALPNNLTGYVPITSVSAKLNERLEAQATSQVSDDDDDGGEDDESPSGPHLNQLFDIGQYLRAYVVSTGDEVTHTSSGAKPKRRIQLALYPQQTNNGLKIDDLLPNTSIMASVASVEDHGVVLDLGLDMPGTRGFMSSKELGPGKTLADMQEGMVLLCCVTGQSSNGKIVKLSSDWQKLANPKKLAHLANASTIDPFLPGTAVEVLISEVQPRGIIGKVMGTLDVTADMIHSGIATSRHDLEKTYKPGAKVNARIICTFPNAEPPKLGISLLDHVVAMKSRQSKGPVEKSDPITALPISSIIEEVKVSKVELGVALFVDVGIKGVPGFVHISRVSTEKVENLSSESGQFAIGSVHRGRVIGYNHMDGMFLVSFEKTILDQPFLHHKDVSPGQVVDGTIEKLIVTSAGSAGLIVKLAEGITGLVPEMHFADVQLLHPERKFKEGNKVKARVLAVEVSKRQIRLTLKKSLVNSDLRPFTAYDMISPGMQCPGTIINLLGRGAVVQFYGKTRGFLPVGEMSEAYIQDPAQHFKLGQVVNAHVLQVDAIEGRLLVSCRDPAVFGSQQLQDWQALETGHLVQGQVMEITKAMIVLDVGEHHLRGTLPILHLTDGSAAKNASALKKIRVGQVLKDMVVLDKIETKKHLRLSSKPSLIKATKNSEFVRSFADLKEGRTVNGFVREITDSAVFVEFGGQVVGLLPKSKLSRETASLPGFGLSKSTSISVVIESIDHEQGKFLLSAIDAQTSNGAELISSKVQQVVNPIDSTIRDIGDYSIGKLTKARILSVKDTQLNVQLADNVQGRIDVSQVFDSWDDIKDRKYPLRTMAPKQVIPVRVIGLHDARNHRFLPITHRAGKNVVFELSAKPSEQNATAQEPLTLDKVEVGSHWLTFVNNISTDCLWVNLSPNVRGRIRLLDLPESLPNPGDLEGGFPVGSAIKVHVTAVDVMNNRLDLSARSDDAVKALDFSELKQGMVLPGRITRSDERQILVQLSDNLSGPVHLTDIADDYDLADPTTHSKNKITRVCVVDVDRPNRKFRLSTRPSRVLRSDASVRDKEILSYSQLEEGMVIRGFIKHVSDKGVFVALGGNVSGFVRVAELSDAYVKDWQAEYTNHQLVKGRIIKVDAENHHAQMSLKASVLATGFKPKITFGDLKVDQVITGTVRKVEDYGIFIVVENSANVSGLCHRSEMADERVHDVKALYEEGDVVKAKILKLDSDRNRISFGLKASYFEHDDAPDDEDLPMGDADDSDSDNESGIAGGVELDEAPDFDAISGSGAVAEDQSTNVASLPSNGFDWDANVFDDDSAASSAEMQDMGAPSKTRKKRRKAQIQVDHTGDLDAHGPQSTSDFERLLLGRPNSAQLWTEYMAFQINLSEVDKAREIAERAFKTINIREDTEKLNMWIALLNLEMSYGTEESFGDVFKRACQYNDAQEVHERITSSYIHAGKHEKADELFQSSVKKFSQSPTIWYNYAHFLHTTLQAADRARALLPRAMQCLPPHTHLALTIKFAALEYHSPAGNVERGRTMFEGVHSAYPKRLDVWNQRLDLEMQQPQADDVVRGVFERLVGVRGLKPKGAKACFRRWSEWEREHGGEQGVKAVGQKAEEWVRKAAERKAGAGAEEV